ncbi:MAG: hypothetical protein ACK53Y_22190, partial [bacterium]
MLAKVVTEEQASLVGYKRSHASSKYTKLISFNQSKDWNKRRLSDAALAAVYFALPAHYKTPYV